MRKILVLLLVPALLVMPCHAEEIELPSLQLYAQAAVLMDADSGRILYEKNGSEPLSMASTTKIMTLVVTLENANLEDIVTVSSYAASMPAVRLGIREGEQYRLYDLLYSLMLESHNDAAVAIAEHVGGSVEGFAVLMNAKAQQIGCEDTCFITPNGLDATAEVTLADGSVETQTHHTTAADLARILSYCVTDSPCRERFLEITRTPSYAFCNAAGTRSFACTNHNAFLSMMSGALTGKTGYTGQAGYCYVGALERDGRTYVVALLACGWPNHKTYKWSDTRALMEYGITYYTYRAFAVEDIPADTYEPILVEDGCGDGIGASAYTDVTLETVGEPCEGVLAREDEEVRVLVQKEDSLQAPVSAGDEVGSVTFFVGEEEWQSYRLLAADSVEQIDYAWCVGQVIARWLL